MIIGICGFIGSGKGTIGNRLSDKWNFKKDSFAAPLKDAVSIIFNWDRKMLEGNTKESREWREKIDDYWSDVLDKEITPRLVLQLFGTESIRDVFGEDIWALSLINRYKNNNEDIVVTDVRFKNEIQAIRNEGGKIWHVKRGDPEWLKIYLDLLNNKKYDKINKYRKDGIIPHRSETDWIDCKFDLVIHNYNSIQALEFVVDSEIQRYR